jgi:hypothetical protein
VEPDTSCFSDSHPPGRDGTAKLIHARELVAFLAWEEIEVKLIGVWTPNQNAVAERFVQSAKQKCLDHFAVIVKTLLRHILSEYMLSHHPDRSPQGMGNRPVIWTEFARADLHRSLGETDYREGLGDTLPH